MRARRSWQREPHPTSPHSRTPPPPLLTPQVNYRVYCPAPDTVTGFAPNPLRIMATVYFPLPASNEVPEVVELEILTYAQQPLTIKV